MEESGLVKAEPFAKLCSGCRNLFEHWDEVLEKSKEDQESLDTSEEDQGSLDTFEEDQGSLDTSAEDLLRFPYDKDLRAWIASSNRGCALCMRLRSCLGRKGLNTIVEYYRHGEKLDLYAEAERLAFLSDRNHTIDCHIRFPRRAAVYQPRLETFTGSDRSLTFAKGWLNDCLSSHPLCRKPSVFQAPTRLLEIYEGGARLCLPRYMPMCPLYLTLSHCWGSMNTLKLKKNNIDSLLREIPVQELCNTFLDALTVTRTLGFNYLWIDSLCIVQDDLADWRRESALMSEIYGNAVVNIAATHADDGSVGLFLERDISRAVRQHIQLPNGEIHELLDPYLYERCITEAPLSRRAWTFQERYLAQRTIHFSAEQIFCECAQHIVCESLPEGVTKRRIGDRDAQFPDKSDTTVATGWNHLVCLYSRAQLTFPKDKLVAISGIARYFGSINQDQYAAGLWTSNLERQLCWSVDWEISSPGTKEKTTLYRAPSWSWASINEPVTWRLYSTNNVLNTTDSDLLIRVNKVELSPIGEDALGELSDAKLKLQCGPLMKSNIISCSIAAQSDPLEPGDCLRAHENLFIRGKWHAIHDRNKTYELMEENVYLLPVMETIHSDYDRVDLYGLVITPANGRDKGYFTRLGCWISPTGPPGDNGA